MMPDYTKAAIKAAETLIKYGVRTSPVSPLPILEQLDNVIVVSFAELSNSSGIADLAQMFGKNRDAVTSIHMETGRPVYVVAYDSLLPANMIQRALAREMGHIILKHQDHTPENEAEAACFVYHFLCPRPLIHAMQAFGLRLTVDLLANLTGVFDQSLLAMRRIPETVVPASMNRFVLGQFLPFVINFFSYYQHVMPRDGSALADFGTFMDGYEE